jgi:hypothetical protein
MGDRDLGKRKVPSYEASGESSEAASRRTRARGAAGPAGERGDNPSLPLGTPGACPPKKMQPSFLRVCPPLLAVLEILGSFLVCRR